MRGILSILTLLALGCTAGAAPSGGGTSPPAPVKLGISNGTTLAVTLVVNGASVGVFPAGGPQPTIDIATLPPLPWDVEARSASRRVLTSMHVESKDIRTTVRSSGVVETTGAMARVDLSCGSLRIWAGDIVPSGPIPASPPGTPGDCEP